MIIYFIFKIKINLVVFANLHYITKNNKKQNFSKIYKNIRFSIPHKKMNQYPMEIIN